MDNSITRYVSRYEPIASDSEKVKEIKTRVKEIIDKVEVRAEDAVKLDQTPEDSYKEIGHAFIKSRETNQDGTIHEAERHVIFTAGEGNSDKADVDFLIDVDRNLTAGDEKVLGGTGYTKFKEQTMLIPSSLQEKINYGISECDPATHKYTKEEVEVSVKGPGVEYSIQDMNDPASREETYFFSKADIGL
jgi:hypothetical protein